MQELEETLLAIQRGQVDAVVVNGAQGDQVFTLQGAEHPYRVLVETMNEGAATLDASGAVLYANASFAAIFGVHLENSSERFCRNISALDDEKLKTLIEEGLKGESRGDVSLEKSDGRRRLVRLSLSPVHDLGIRTICVIATDMTELSGATKP